MGDVAAVKAVLFDWAGTTVDFGSRAPAKVFVEIFRHEGIDISEAEARAFMGMGKLDHIAAVLALPRVADEWRRRHGRAPEHADAGRLYERFLPLQKEILAARCDLIPGVLEATAYCWRRGLQIGSTTGYTRELMAVVLPHAAAQGYAPDVTVCVDDVPAGRPAPWMNLRAAETLGVYPLSAVVAVDDTPVGIAAARNAGMVAVGVTESGNGFGLSEPELQALPAAERAARHERLVADYLAIGAQAVLRSVAELPAWLDRQSKP